MTNELLCPLAVLDQTRTRLRGHGVKVGDITLRNHNAHMIADGHRIEAHHDDEYAYVHASALLVVQCERTDDVLDAFWLARK